MGNLGSRMRDDHESGEMLGLALACVGGVLCIVSGFVPVFSGAGATLFETDEVPSGFGLVFVGGGLMVAVFAATAFMSRRGTYAILATLVAVLTYVLALLLAWGDAIALDGRGPAIYLSAVGATLCAIGAVACTLFSPDFFERHAARPSGY